jgi:hypothetical protein
MLNAELLLLLLTIISAAATDVITAQMYHQRAHIFLEGTSFVKHLFKPSCR